MEEYLVAVDIMKCHLGVTEKEALHKLGLGESVKNDYSTQKKVRVLDGRD
ncbi:hypothetical protein [Paraphotobacterium marinum]|nr:hypothetical protein [Paraphotobacterium marinum]